MILITGAGGKTGRALIQTLSKAESICAFVRREEYVSVTTSLGAEKVMVGDMRDESAICAAMEIAGLTLFFEAGGLRAPKYERR